MTADTMEHRGTLNNSRLGTVSDLHLSEVLFGDAELSRTQEFFKHLAVLVFLGSDMVALSCAFQVADNVIKTLGNIQWVGNLVYKVADR